jgi:hypothetical protein
MKFFFILNNENKSIEFGKTTSERYEILKKIAPLFNDQVVLQLISLNILDVEKLLKNLITERNLRHSDHPDHSNKFYKEINLFVTKRYKNKDFLLCQTGFDNKIIFLINILDSLLKDEQPYHLLFTDNHKEFKEWQSKISH